MRPEMIAKPMVVCMARLMMAGAIFSVCFWTVCDGKAQTVTVANNSFETPALAPDGYQYDPGGATWLFVQNSGIINAPGDGFLGPPAPDGSQYAFLQTAGNSNGDGAFSQSINFSLAGTYELSFMVAGRPNNGAGAAGDLPYEVRLDSTVIGTDTTISAQPFTTRSFVFTTSAGNQTLTFEVSAGATGDNTAFFDAVTIQAVPEPRAAMLVILGLLAGVVARYSFKPLRRA
jgi:hypothetical protein